MTKSIRNAVVAIALVLAAFLIGFGALPTIAQNLPPAETITQPVAESELTAPERTEAPTNAVTPETEAEPPGIGAQIYAFLTKAIGEALFYVVGVAFAWAAGALGFNQWNAAKVQEALHNEKMKPYTEGVIRFVVDLLASALNRQPQVLEVVNWIKDQFPEVFAWMGRTDKERVGYVQTFIGPMPLKLEQIVGVGVSGSTRRPPRRATAKPTPKPPGVLASSTATATPPANS